MSSEFLEGKYSDSHEYFEAQCAQYPENPTAFINKAASQYGLELYRGCVADCNKALEIDPNHLQAYFLKGYALLRCSGKSGGLKKAQKAWQSGVDHFLSNPSSTGDVLMASQLSALARCSSPPPHLELGHVSSPLAGTPVAATSKVGAPSPLPPAAITPPKPPEENGVKNSKPDPAAVAMLEALAVRTVASIGLNSQVLAQARANLAFGTGIESIDNLIAIGYLQVNSGNHKLSIEIFDRVLSVFPTLVGAHLGIGSSKAFSGDLDGAVEHFTKAIQAEPMAADAWKRRAQTLASQGKLKEALRDVERALELPNDDIDMYNQRGIIYFKMKNYRKAHENFLKVTAVHRQDKTVWTQLGLVEGFLGDIDEAIKCFEKALELDPNHVDAHLNRAQMLKERGQAIQALHRYNQVLLLDHSNCNAICLKGECYYSLGEIQKCLETVETAFPFDSKNQKCHMRAALCCHSLGKFSESIQHYDLILVDDPPNECFYNREVALVCWNLLDKPFQEYNLDVIVDRSFKDAWCKKHNHFTAMKEYRKKTAPSNIPDVAQNMEISEELVNIRDFAQELGRDLQLNCVGFNPNRRQHLMAGLSIIEISQAFHKHWKDLRSGGQGLMVPNSRSSESDKFMNSEGSHILGYRDIFDIAVKWRQLSEPGDTVWWIDKLPYKAFEEGFGLQTPMVTGQSHVIRYYPYFDQSFAIMKRLMAEQCNLTSGDAALVQGMKDLKALHDLIGHDFWVVTPCHSRATPGAVMEGTRLTIVAQPPEGYVFNIRTPGTPHRWIQFDAELKHVFKQLDEAVCAGPENVCTDMVLDIAISIFYYWVNFAPLSRGSAACGYIITFAVLHAAGFELVQPMKKDVQWDWEAILSPTPEKFSEKFKPWLLSQTSKKDSIETENSLSESNDLDKTPFMETILQFSDIQDVCESLRSSIQLLNSAPSWTTKV